jgi:hypothetical protein
MVVDEKMKLAMDYRRIVQAGNAMHNFGLEVGTAVSPLLQLPARGIVAVTKGFNKQSVRTRQEELGAGAVGAAGLILLLKRLGGPKVGVGGLIRGGGFVGAGTAALTEHQIGHTPLNPLFVAIVYNLGGRTPGVPGGGKGADAEKAGENIEQKASKWLFRGWVARGAVGAARTVGARIPGVARAGIPFLGAEMPGIPDVLSILTGGDPFGYNKWAKLTPKQQKIVNDAKRHPMLNRMLVKSAYGGSELPNIQTAYDRLAALSGQNVTSAGGQTLAVKGKADLAITIDPKGGRQKYHATLDLFPDFTVPAPQTKAKPTHHRSGK